MGASFYVRMSGLYMSTEELFLSPVCNQYIVSFTTGFLSSLLNSFRGFLRYPVSLCLSVTLLSKYLFFDPPTQTLVRKSHV